MSANSVKITVLIENTALRSDLISEHGLSLFIEVDNKKILFDTGASNSFLANAETLGIKIDSCDFIILSHGHYDHTGGLKYIADKPVYYHSALLHKKYKGSENGYKFIGIEKNKSEYERHHHLNFFEIDTIKELIPNVTVLIDFAKDPIKNFYLKNQQTFIPDTFPDECAIAIDTDKGVIIITGCGHSGILNIIEKALSVTKKQTIYALIGGFHLSGLPDNDVRIIAEKLLQYDITYIGISHCTGSKLAEFLPDEKVFTFNTGDVFKF
ncbi:MBL fold metallo-hydrolase [Thermoproteota archaeon]